MPGAWAILLAAGESRRMGELKALLPWQGASLIDHQITSLLAAGVEGVVVVLGHQSERLAPSVEGHHGALWVLNPDYLQGKTTSIKAGLDGLGAADLSEILLLNVDQPRSAPTIKLLLEQHRAAGQLITIPEYQGKGGHPIIISASLLPELKGINEADLGIKAVTRRHANRSQRIDLDAAEVLLDLNTPEQYQAALETGR